MPAQSAPAPVLLLDTASLYYRSYFALPETLVAPDGTPVNAVRGVLDTVAAMVSARGSTRVVACWDDDWRPQWRVDLVPSYKTHRIADDASALGVAEGEVLEDVPDTLSPQVDLLREMLPVLGIPVVGAPEAEADDVIADLSTQLPGPVDIASGDRDLVQLVDDRVTLLFTGGNSASRGGKPWVTIDPQTAAERFGVAPSQYADLAILRGDPSDGLPGARGIGDKTAQALVLAYGDLHAILAAAQDPSTGKPMTPAVRQRLLDAHEHLLDAERVVRLSHQPGRSVLSREAVPSIEEGVALAEKWGVQASARRLITALQAVAE